VIYACLSFVVDVDVATTVCIVKTLTTAIEECAWTERSASDFPVVITDARAQMALLEETAKSTIGVTYPHVW